MSWQCFEHNIGLQPIQNLVVSEETTFWQVPDALTFDQLIIRVVEQLNYSLRQKEDLLDSRLI
jgi:hypothetical protein